MLSEEWSAQAAVDDVLDQFQPAGFVPDAAFVFLSSAHRDEAETIMSLLAEAMGFRVIIGCCAEAVIGPGREAENAPGLAVLAAALPGVHLHPFHIGRDDWRKLLADDDELRRRVGVDGRTRGVIGRASCRERV